MSTPTWSFSRHNSLINLLFLLLVWSLTFPFSASAQRTSTGRINGRVVEQHSEQPVEYATIMLKDSATRKMVTGVITDSSGLFIIEKVQPGHYFLESSFIGYEKQTSRFFTIGKKQLSVDIGVMPLTISAANLEEVTVTGERNMMITRIDRKVFNVTKDIMAQTGTVSDVLQTIPSVSVDIDGNISLRGSGSVTILINGRPSVMGSSANLEQMPASMIERVEVITNPSAKYKPDGTGGIINIILKKERKAGYNGSLSANVGNSDRYNTTLQANLNTGKFNLFGSYGFRKDYRYRTGSVNSQTIDTTDGSSVYQEQSSEGEARPLSHLARIGIDWTPGKTNMAGIAGTFNYREVKRNDLTDYHFLDDTLATTEDYYRTMQGKETETSVGITGYYEHTFNKETDSKLRADFEYQQDHEIEDDNYTNTYRFPAFPDDVNLANRDNSTKEINLTLAWNRPLWQKSEFEAGYEGNMEITDQNQQVSAYDPDSAIWIPDPEQDNRYHSNQSVHALYATLNQSVGKFSFLAGLRAEQALVDLDFISIDTTARTDYFALYPTIHMGYATGDHEWQLNYSRRVNRPDGDNMNPMPEYRDPRNIFVGNPNLKPEDIHSIEAGYSYRNDFFSLVPTLFYRIKVNGFSMVTRSLNDSVLVTTIDNLSSDQSAGLDISGTWKPYTWLNFNASASMFYNTIDASEIGYSSEKTAVSWNGKLNANFNITKSTIFQANGNYRSEMLTAQGTRSPSWVVNLGLRQELWKKKAALVFTVSDLFNTQRMTSNVNTSELVMETMRKRDGRVVYGGFIFNFGSNGKKSKETRFEFDNQMER
jgi:outer membrane receptor protein involved in Fe transport